MASRFTREELEQAMAWLELLAVRTKFEQSVFDHWTHRGKVSDRQVEIVIARMNHYDLEEVSE